MLDIGDYLVGYQRGKQAAEGEQHIGRMVDLLWGRRTVEVDQSYIDGLHAAVQREQAAAEHNYRAGESWRATAWRLQAELAKAKATLESNRIKAHSRLSRREEWRQSLLAQRNSLAGFHYLMAILFTAEAAGKSGSPEYRELKSYAQ